MVALLGVEGARHWQLSGGPLPGLVPEAGVRQLQRGEVLVADDLDHLQDITGVFLGVGGGLGDGWILIQQNFSVLRCWPPILILSHKFTIVLDLGAGPIQAPHQLIHLKLGFVLGLDDFEHELDVLDLLGRVLLGCLGLWGDRYR